MTKHREIHGGGLLQPYNVQIAQHLYWGCYAMALMSAGGANKNSWYLNMSRTVTEATTTITFLEKGTYKISGTYDAGWICGTKITCKGVQRGYVENGNSGNLDFTIDAIPNDTLVIYQKTDQKATSNRYCHTNLNILKIK